MQLRTSSFSCDTNSVESHSRIMPSAIYMTVENEIGQKEKLNMSVVSRQKNSEQNCTLYDKIMLFGAIASQLQCKSKSEWMRNAP